MATTTYTIAKMNVEGEFVAVDTKSKKATALTLAQEIRSQERVSVRVVTGAGTEVLLLKARKPQKKTRPYTRVIDLPEGFKIPDSERPAYDRSRKGCVITHEAEEGIYRVRALDGARVLGVFSTTRQCGRFLADNVSLNDTGALVVAD